MRYLIFLAAVFIYACSSSSNEVSINKMNSKTEKLPYAMAIHGGAGTITKANMTPEKEAAITKVMTEALEKGEALLQAGKDGVDVVEAVIHILEDSPLFNAGKGAVFNFDGENELDASIMTGQDLMAGAVGGVSTVKNPISAAKAVMQNSDHVMLSGKGADVFAKEQGLEIVDPSYFFTENRKKSLDRAKQKLKKKLTEDDKHGTVGCVVLDKKGNLVAGTSTGGMTNKRWNRIGDSPIIGAGTYANNNSCAVSCTGHGEYFIRYAVAYDVSAMMEYKGYTLVEATNEVIHDKLKDAGGSGGLIAVDSRGNIAMPFNTEGMYRGYLKPGKKEVLIYKND